MSADGAAIPEVIIFTSSLHFSPVLGGQKGLRWTCMLKKEGMPDAISHVTSSKAEPWGHPCARPTARRRMIQLGELILFEATFRL